MTKKTEAGQRLIKAAKEANASLKVAESKTGLFRVTSPDTPEIHAVGQTRDSALQVARAMIADLEGWD